VLQLQLHSLLTWEGDDVLCTSKSGPLDTKLQYGHIHETVTLMFNA